MRYFWLVQFVFSIAYGIATILVMIYFIVLIQFPYRVIQLEEYLFSPMESHSACRKVFRACG